MKYHHIWLARFREISDQAIKNLIEVLGAKNSESIGSGRIAFTLFIMPREFHKMPALPDTIDDPKVQELMSHYFATSNHDSDHEGFVEMFTADGEYSMNDRKAKGRQEIIDMRRGLWSHIPTRDHTPHQIYTHGTDQLQLMSRGHIKYQHHMGHEADNEWAAYYELEKDEKGVPKLQKIHIITDSNKQV